MLAISLAIPDFREYLKDLTARGLLTNPAIGHALAVEKLVRMHFTTGNDAELLVDGEATFESIFD